MDCCARCRQMPSALAPAPAPPFLLSGQAASFRSKVLLPATISEPVSAVVPPFPARVRGLALAALLMSNPCNPTGVPIPTGHPALGSAPPPAPLPCVTVPLRSGDLEGHSPFHVPFRVLFVEPNHGPRHKASMVTHHPGGPHRIQSPPFDTPTMPRICHSTNGIRPIQGPLIVSTDPVSLPHKVE